MSPTDFDWNVEIATQLQFHWDQQLQPRLAGLTNEEYFWEPVPGMWTVRRTDYTGQYANDFTVPAPDPEPVTTIAWRLHHLAVVLETSMVQVGGTEIDWTDTTPPAATAAEALQTLSDRIDEFQRGVRALGVVGLQQPARTQFTRDAGLTVLGTVLHNYREVSHHGAEVALLRDLYRAQQGSEMPST